MSWVEVDFNLVRYSPVEQTHFFYDPAYPSSVQFLLNGRWEPWDVRWVQRNARDVEVRRIAEDAARYLNHAPFPGNELASPYGAQAQVGYRHASSQSPATPSLPSPTNADLATSALISGPRSYTANEVAVPSPTSPHPSGRPPPSLASPIRTRPYVSPYEPVTPVSDFNQPTRVGQKSNRLPPRPSSNGQQAAAPHLARDASTDYGPPPTQISSVNRETKILLSLDGDGIRGLSAVLVVESLVNAVCAKINRQVDPFQLFDIIGGVSGGGLLAIMLGRLRMRPHRAREAYIQLAQTMYFDKRQFFLSLDPRTASDEYYSNARQAHIDAISEIVKHETGGTEELFIDPRVDSTHVFVVSTQVDVGINRAVIIRSYPSRRMAGPEVPADLTICEAMRATSAAPRYILPSGGANLSSILGPGLFDYGTTKNNPVQDMVFECRKLYSFANDTQIIISIGAGNGPDKYSESQEMVNNIELRNSEGANTRQKFEAENQGVMQTGWMKYFRFEVPMLDNVPLQEWNQVDAVMEKTRAYLAQAGVGQMFYACVDAIAALLVGQQATGQRMVEAGFLPAATNHPIFPSN